MLVQAIGSGGRHSGNLKKTSAVEVVQLPIQQGNGKAVADSTGQREGGRARSGQAAVSPSSLATFHIPCSSLLFTANFSSQDWLCHHCYLCHLHNT